MLTERIYVIMNASNINENLLNPEKKANRIETRIKDVAVTVRVKRTFLFEQDLSEILYSIAISRFNEQNTVA